MPLYQLLTDRTLAEASAITPTTLIHIVTTADTRQNSAGSSYKAELGQLVGLFSGGSVSGEYLPLSGGTVTGSTSFTNGLTANTISATTYQNLPISGTHNYLSKFSSGATILVDSQLRDDGSTIGLGLPPNVNAKLFVLTSSEPYGLAGQNQNTNGIGVYGQALALGNTTGVVGVANGTSTSNIGVYGQANEATTNIGLKGYAFNGTNNYSIQLLDGTEGVGKVLTSVTSDGKANWQILPSFTGGTVSGNTNFTNGITANTVSATTYYNLPPKEVFYKSHSTEALVSLGKFVEPAYNGGTSPVYISGIIPYDFDSNISSEIVLISTTSDTETIELNFSSGSVGGGFSATTGFTSFSKTYTPNIFDTVNVDNFFSGITANQIFSLSIFDNGGSDRLVIGIKFKYNTI